MSRLTPVKRTQVIASLVEGNSIRAAVHMTGVAKNTSVKHAVPLHFMRHNFCRVHQTLRVISAMEAGIADHVWSIEEIVQLLELSKQREAA